jgi:N-acetylglucosamine-6-phosphate deacetylase
MKAFLSLCALVLSVIVLPATSPIAPRPNGMAHDRPTRHMLVGATIHVGPGETLDASRNPAVLIEDGTIIGVLESADTARIKPGFQIHQFTEDHHIYAGFIDAYVEVDAPSIDRDAPGAHWNRMVTPQRDVLEGSGLTTKQRDALRADGFTSAMIAPKHGVFRGWTAVVSTAAPLSDPSLGHPPVHRARAGQMHGFDRTSWADADYPTSHMGVMALLRQTFSDAQTRAGSAHSDDSCLDSVRPGETTLFYETNQELEALLADKVAREFEHPNLVIVGSGAEHRRLSAFVEMGHPVIVPLRYPETPKVATINDADRVGLAELQHWERAPANARWLHNSGVPVALTSSKLRSGDSFWTNLHTAIEKGLPEDDALAMLTTNPARILGLENQGTIANGNIANLVVSRGDLFDPSADAFIVDTWADGRQHTVKDDTDTSFDGVWVLNVAGSDETMELTIADKKVSVTRPTDTSDDEEPSTHDAKNVTMKDKSISFTIDDKPNGSGITVLSGTLTTDGTIRGTGLAPAQDTFHWTAQRTGDAVSLKDFKGAWNALLSEKFELTFDIKGDKVTVIEHVEGGDDITQEATDVELEGSALNFAFEHEPFGMKGIFTIALSAPKNDQLSGTGALPSGSAFTLTATKDEDPDPVHGLPDLPDAPFGPYAFDETPAQKSVLITGATIWTQSDRGILEDGWILIRNGKIHSVGTGGYPRIAVDETIDGEGLHVTPGLIDAHSHTGLFRFGVNESGQAVTSEVRIADSLDPGHIGFYRELAGGLTSALLLHGSANPIGGQSQTVKLRWNSARPEDMHFENAKPGIKFALGENVKQSNWGDDQTTRYPQTRMGVETTFRDRFTKAREYADRGMKTLDGGRDLELEALAQILAGERWVHCHSYRQDEILMLCRIAEEFGFKIGTFQHGLETYKVAEIVKEHAVGASIFSDWWAYKVEVQDAIPFAGPINHAVGLNTSFNSDSDDLARRMNVEAGKALKYAKMSGIEMSEQDALAFVTTNPAIQLDIIDRVGTLEPGKDADIAIWSGHPLSSLSRCERTFVDGRTYFSIEDDRAHRERIRAERERLVQLVLRDGKPSESADEPGSDEDAPTRGFGRFIDQYNHANQGDCGCNDLFSHYHTGY